MSDERSFRRVESAPDPHQVEEPHFRPLGLAQGVGLFAAPLAWFFQLLIAFALVRAACEASSVWMLHLVAVLALAGAVVGIVNALRAWKGKGGGLHEIGGGAVEDRGRFMGQAGTITSAFFVLLIILTWLTVFVLHPCWE